MNTRPLLTAAGLVIAFLVPSIGSGQVVTLSHAIGPNSPAPGPASQGAVDVVMAQFALTASGDNITVLGVLITAGGTADDAAGVMRMQIWKDDGDGMLNRANDRLFGSATNPFPVDNGAATITFGGQAAFIVTPGTPSYLLVTYDFATALPACGAFTVAMADGNATIARQQGGEPNKSGAFPLVASPRTVSQLAESVGPANPAAQEVTPGASSVPIFQFVLDAACGGEPIDVTTVTLTLRGTAAPTHLLRAELWLDRNGDGFADPSDRLLASIVGPSAPTFQFMAAGAAGTPLVTVAPGAPATFVLAYVLAESAPLGTTVGSILGGIVSKCVISGGSPVLTFSGAKDSALVTVVAPQNADDRKVPGGVSARYYLMFSPSIDTGSTGFDQIRDQLGPPGAGGGWRLFRYNPSTRACDEYGSPEFAKRYPVLYPQFGWWLISRQKAELAFTGRSTESFAAFTLSVESGWNQIGNPYNGPLPFSFVRVPQFGGGSAGLNDKANATTLPVLYRYTGGQYVAETATMHPGVGYWMRLVDERLGPSVTVTIDRPPYALKPGDAASQERELEADEELPPSPPGGDFAEGDSSSDSRCFASAGGRMPGTAMALAVLALTGGLGLRSASAHRRRLRAPSRG